VVRPVREARGYANALKPFPIYESQARSILSQVSGFISEAGFTHSLTPARNCTFACTYCYVPTMRIHAGLKPADWQRWGDFTTVKTNAAELLHRELRPHQVIYCSPLVDPYQPAEETTRLMPGILDVLLDRPPRVLAIQTRGPLILRDLDRLRELGRRTTLRISFSVTTNREDVRRWFEPHCAPFEQRLDVMRSLSEAGIDVYATLAPLLPCDPEVLARAALEATGRDLVGDPFHVRATKRHGATTREQAWRIAEKRGFEEWFDPAFQARIVQQFAAIAGSAGRRFVIGPAGFGSLARVSMEP
jgi:DNA repair photolyase